MEFKNSYCKLYLKKNKSMTILQNPVKQSSSLTFALLFEKTKAICTAGMLVHLCLLKTAHKSILFLPFLIWSKVEMHMMILN